VLARIGVEALLRVDLSDMYEGYAKSAPRLDWYIAGDGGGQRGEG
jgi:hypothetical protein